MPAAPLFGTVAAGPEGLIDRMIGEEYEIVKSVAEDMQKLDDFIADWGAFSSLAELQAAMLAAANVSNNAAQVAGQAQTTAVDVRDRFAGYAAWAVGTATGGPSSDGLYPLVPTAGGSAVLVPSPALLAARISRASLGYITPQAYSAVGDGTADDRAALAAADAAAVSAGSTLLITKPHKIGSNLTLNAPLKILPGGKLIRSNPVNLTITGEIEAGHYPIFGGWVADEAPRVFVADDKLAFTITKGQTVRPEWFGAFGDGTTNDKPAWQRLAYAAPDAVSIVCRRKATYLFDSGGLCDRIDRPSHAMFTLRGWVDFDLNGSTLRLADNTHYCLMYFAGTDAQATVNRFFHMHGGGILDGNRAGNEAQYEYQRTHGGSSSNKGYGRLIVIQGYEQVLVENVLVINTIHVGVDARNCETTTFRDVRARGGYPMKWTVHTDQAHYFAARNNYMGRSFFRGIDCEGGSHHITAHTDINDLDPVVASRTACYIDGYNGLNWSESGIHVEESEEIKITNIDMKLDDAAYSSDNVGDIFIRANSRRAGIKHLTVAISNVSMENGIVQVYSEMGNADNRPGRVSLTNVHVTKTIGGLMVEPQIKAPDGDLINCSVRGTVENPINDLAITATSAMQTTVDYSQGVQIYRRFHGEVLHTTGDAIKTGGQVAQVDALIDGATVGIRPRFAVEVRGTISNVQKNAISSSYTDGYIRVLGARIENWGLNTAAPYAERAAIGGADTNGDGAACGVIELRDVTFVRTDANCHNQALRATHSGQVSTSRGCIASAGMLGQQGTSGAIGSLEPFIGEETITTSQVVLTTDNDNVGQRIAWQAYKLVHLALTTGQTLTHMRSSSTDALSLKGTSFVIMIDNANVTFDFTQPKVVRVVGALNEISYPLRHTSKTTWTPTAGSWMRVTWTGSGWFCETADAA
jgi:hypothetical protein